MEIAVLSDEQIRKLHEASLNILDNVGVLVPHAEALDLLHEAGAKVDRERQHAKIPEHVIAHALDVCGKTFTIYGRERSKTAEFGRGKRNYNSSAGQAFWIDDLSKERKYATLAGVTTAARFADALPNINIVGSMSDPQELPREYRCVFVAAELLKNTTKPITFWFHDRASARFVVDLFTIVAGSVEEASAFPFAYPLLEPISPLRLPREGVDLLFETCKFPLPVAVGPMAQTGATAPGTLAGTLAQENAEILAGLTIVQLIRPGTPVCYGGIPHAFDMKTMQIVFAGPEQTLMAVAMTQMGKFYDLPVYINVGLTDSNVADAQAGLEIGITLACGALAGADVFGHFGISGTDQGASLAILTLQHEIISYIERLLQGIAIDDEKVGIDVIRKVGCGGSFLAEIHTATHFRNELWFPKLLNRDQFEIWANGNHKDMLERCCEMKDSVLSEHQPDPLPDETLKELNRLLEDAKRHLSRE